MAHSLWTPEQVSRYALAALRHVTSLPRTVYRDFGTEFLPGRGATLNIRKPISAGAARVYTPAMRAARQAIQFNDLTDDFVPIKLDTQVYNAVRLPDDFATFTLENLSRQVLVPQAESVVDAVVKPLIDEMVAIDTDAGLEVDGGGTNALRVVTRARKILNDRNVPLAGRILAVGTGLAEDILNLDTLTRVNEAGDSSALRQGTIGTLRGFTIIEDQALPEYVGVAYQREAFAHITRTTAQPEGAGASGVTNQDGFSLRWIRHYNPLQLEDQSVLDTFAGAETLDDRRAVKITKADAPDEG